MKHGMRWIAAVVLLLGIIVAGVPAQAQAKTLWDYQKEIGLSDKQVTDMKEALNDENRQLDILRKQLQEAQSLAVASIENTAPIEQVKSRLEQVASLQVQMRLLDVVTARRISAMMSKDQLAKWREVQKKARESKG